MTDKTNASALELKTEVLHRMAQTTVAQEMIDGVFDTLMPNLLERVESGHIDTLTGMEKMLVATHYSIALAKSIVTKSLH